VLWVHAGDRDDGWRGGVMSTTTQLGTRTRDTSAAVEARRLRVAARMADLIEDLEWMAKTGEDWEGAAKRLELKPKTLEDKCCKAGRFDLVTALRRNANTASGVHHGRACWGRWSA
jgi:hypothetical protein